MREEIKGMGGKVGTSEKSWGNGNHNKNTLCEKKTIFIKNNKIMGGKIN